MELIHFCIFFAPDLKAIYKNIDSGRIKNMNGNANNMQSLGMLLNSKQQGGLGGRFSGLIRLEWKCVLLLFSVVWVLHTGCDSLTLRSAWEPPAGHSQALFRGCVLLILTALNEAGNLTAFSFLYFFANKHVQELKGNQGNTGKQSAASPFCGCGRKTLWAPQLLREQREEWRVRRPAALGTAPLSSMLMGVAPRKVSPMGGSWEGGGNWSPCLAGPLPW